MTLISLQQARTALEAAYGPDIQVCLEPDDIMAKKVEQKKEAELWCFDFSTGYVGRDDQKFYQGRMVKHPGGWYVYALHEEPTLPQGEGPRLIGHMVVTVNGAGLLKVRKAKGLDEEVLEFQPSSVSKNEHGQVADQLQGAFYANCQRIQGAIGVYLRTEEFPIEQGMTPQDFRAQSTDGRSLSALAILQGKGLVA